MCRISIKIARIDLFLVEIRKAKATIDNAMAKGVRVKMVAGDDTAIARETARQLGLGTNIIPAADAFPKDMDPTMFRRRSPKGSNERTGLPACFPSTNTRHREGAAGTRPSGGDDRRWPIWTTRRNARVRGERRLVRRDDAVE